MITMLSSIVIVSVVMLSIMVPYTVLHFVVRRYIKNASVNGSLVFEHIFSTKVFWAETWIQGYKTFYVRNLRMFLIR
jgi:hypothetical protein